LRPFVNFVNCRATHLRSHFPSGLLATPSSLEHLPVWETVVAVASIPCRLALNTYLWKQLTTQNGQISCDYAPPCTCNPWGAEPACAPPNVVLAVTMCRGFVAVDLAWATEIVSSKATLESHLCLWRVMCQEGYLHRFPSVGNTIPPHIGQCTLNPFLGGQCSASRQAVMLSTLLAFGRGSPDWTTFFGCDRWTAVACPGSFGARSSAYPLFVGARNSSDAMMSKRAKRTQK
jgi:hypothetical protein